MKATSRDTPPFRARGAYAGLYIAIVWTALCLFLAQGLCGQGNHRKSYFPIWTFHQDSININGLSVGLWSFAGQQRNTRTNGAKVELIGVGIGIPLIPSSPVVGTDSMFQELKQEQLSERINGLNLSTSGTVCHCLTNGLTAGFIGQINFQVNGISTSIIANFSQKQNGIMAALFNEVYELNGIQMGFANSGYKTRGLQMGLFRNYSDEMKGLQIGLLNHARRLKGIQIGLWNINPKRKLPLVNWNFK